MISAIGEQELIDTAQDPRLGRIFFNRTIKRYKAFEGFYGMEDTIERIVGYFKHAAQGLEEKRQIIYLLGPVGGGKSSLAERLKELMEKRPIYVLKAGNQISPVFRESARTVSARPIWPTCLEDKYGIERHRLSRRDEPVGGEAARTNSAATFRNSKSRASIRPSCARSHRKNRTGR